MPLEQGFVAGGAPSRVQRYQIERRRVGRSVIGGVRNQLEMRELAEAQLVKDFAGMEKCVLGDICESI